MTSAAQPKWINDPIAAAIGRIVILEERVAECEQQRELIEHQDARIKVLESRLAEFERQPDLLTENEAATLLRVHIVTLKRWRAGRTAVIPFIQYEGGDVRYRWEEIESYLQRRERGAKKRAAQ